MIEPGMSGGNRIFIELAKNWVKTGHQVTVFTSPVGKQICQANDLMGARYVTWPAQNFRFLGIFGQYFVGVFWGLWNALKSWRGFENVIVWSTSDFWPDALSGLLFKIINPKCFWIASVFMFAPNPFKQTKFYVKAFLHFITQKPIYFLSKKIAQMIFVTNDGDRDFVVGDGVPAERVVSIRGGVNLDYIQSIRAEGKKYLGIFMGRVHRHKGILELLDVWRKVCDVMPQAKLAVVGEGPQEKEAKEKAEKLGLKNNVVFFGFVDGDYKYILMKESQMFLHSSVWDSGGMSAAEGMACGLPVVGYDLPAFKTYYPKGMLKAPLGDRDKYAELIISLANDVSLYQKISAKALDWANGWDWAVNASRIMQAIDGILK
jgi:glycosyltransferase involved in cell wall biosynthesis